jgi:hypothetical protein
MDNLYSHSSQANDYQVNAQSELAMLYNDESVLQNYHCATLFRLMRTEGLNCNVFENLNSTQYRQARYAHSYILHHPLFAL